MASRPRTRIPQPRSAAEDVYQGLRFFQEVTLAANEVSHTQGRRLGCLRSILDDPRGLGTRTYLGACAVRRSSQRIQLLQLTYSAKACRELHRA